jgi:hypothetical protein
MDDVRCTRRRAAALMVSAAVCAASGCRLFVTAGKVLFGDPKMDCAFRKSTSVDLTEGQDRVLVVCSTPESLRSDWSSLNIDLIDGITRRLKNQGIKVVKPDEVASWIDDNGGQFDDLSGLADEFEADYIIHLNLDRFTYLGENTKTMYRGKSHGTVTAHHADLANGVVVARIKFEREFNSEYPQYPVSADTVDAKVFQKQYMDRICDQVAFLFYDHRPSQEVQ